MGQIVLVGLFAVLAGVCLASANRFAQIGNRDHTWISLTLGAVFVIAACLVLALDLSEHASSTQASNRGFGSGWSCAYRTDFCFRR